MIDEKMEKWEKNNPEKLSAQITGEYKRTSVDAYATYDDTYTISNLKDGKYLVCDWCNETDYNINDEPEMRFFETMWDLYMHFVEEHDLLEYYQEIEINEQGVLDPELSMANEVADEILKKKGLSIKISTDDAVKLALNNEIDAEL